ncbi:uncharacterized protein C05D11.1 [Trichonephila clavipes]|nr:uncharacterized protein C05D11.1 [Trichonephila clavipes]
MSGTSIYECIAEILTDGDIKLSKYKSTKSGMTICIAEADGPLVGGYLCVATEAHDDDGLPHTLEHLVFMGSEKYPYKGVLDLAASRCLAQGTNAWTDTDHTCYTVSTAGDEGFLKLLPIYIDHLLYPTLTDSAFTTEVHSINGDGEDTGIVYCEMQTRENSGESLCHLAMLRSMYPGLCGYKSETGGLLKNLRESTTNEKAKKLSAADIHRELCAVYGPNIMSEGVVRQWVRFFKDGRTNIHEESQSGRTSVVSADLIKEIDEKIRLLRNFTISQLSEHFPNISRTILYETVMGKLGYRKFCARWVPKMLTEIHKTSRMGTALEFLSRYHTDGGGLFEQNGDETWVAHVNVETKQQSVAWVHTGSPTRLRKARQTLSARKLMVTVFWDVQGILLIEFMTHGTTINSEVYSRTLKKLKRAIQNKRCGLLSSGVVLLHNNVCPHTAVRTREVLCKFKWDVFQHPPYSPDLAPSDYHLFTAMKKWLGGKHFADDAELKNAVTHWFKSQVKAYHKEFYRPENLCVIIVGQVNAEKVFEALQPVEERIAKDSKRTPFVRPWQSPVPPLVESTTLEVNYPSDEDEHGLVIAAWRGPLANDYSQLISIQILMDYLTDTSVSPLNRELIETDDPLCNQVDYTVIENYESCIYVHLSNVPVKKLQEVKEKYVHQHIN